MGFQQRYFFFRQTSQVSAKRPKAMNSRKPDDMGQCDKREKARVGRRERRFVNGVAGESLVALSSELAAAMAERKGETN